MEGTQASSAHLRSEDQSLWLTATCEIGQTVAVWQTNSSNLSLTL